MASPRSTQPSSEIGLLLIGVPLVLPLSVLTFMLAFIPMIGAIIAQVVSRRSSRSRRAVLATRCLWSSYP